MGRLRQPELAPGALADLVRELHALHVRAGRPSTRELAKGQRFSYTAVHDLFTKTTAEPPRLPLLLVVVERLATIAPRMNVEATLDRFDALWQAADAKPFEQPPTAIASCTANLSSQEAGTGDPVAEREPVLLTPDEQTEHERSGVEPGRGAEESLSNQPQGRAMTKELFFLASSPAPLHDAAAELRRAGYLVRNQPRDLDGTWSLMAYSAASELTDDDLTTLDRIAERCGVDFDGWGTYVGPPQFDDGPGKSATGIGPSVEPLANTGSSASPTSIVEHQLNGHTGVVTAVAIVQLEERPVVVSGGKDQTVRVWDMATGQPLASPFTGHKGAVTAVAFAQLGGRPVVVSNSNDQTVRVWDLASAQPIGSPFNTGVARAVATGQLDGRPVVVCSTGKWIRVWDLATGQPVRMWNLAINDPSQSVFIQANEVVMALATEQLDGRPMVIAGIGPVLRMWDLAAWDLATGGPAGSTLLGHIRSVTAMATAHLDGRPVVVSGSWDKTVRVWDLATGRPLESLFIGHTGPVTAVAVAQSDGRPIVVSVSNDETVRLWDMASGQSIGSPIDTGAVTAVAIGQLDERPVMVSGAGETVRVWDLTARAYS